jgi:hypothetical protein
MSDVMKFVQNEDGTFNTYDDTYDIVMVSIETTAGEKTLPRMI